MMSISTVVSRSTMLTPGSSANAAGVCPALLGHPRCGVVVPIVSLVRDRSGRREESFPTPLVVKAPPHRVNDEAAAAPRANKGVDPSSEVVVEQNVHPHVLILAHTAPPTVDVVL